MKKYTLQELRTPEFKIGKLGQSVRFVISNEIVYSDSLSLHDCDSLISFGSVMRGAEEYIKTEKLDYTGRLYCEIPVSEFRRLGLLDEFVLPESYYIITTSENLKTVEQWWRKTFPNDSRYFAVNHGYGFINGKSEARGEGHTKGLKEIGGTEITFEQFKEHVLNSKENTMKKIKGYNIKAEYKGKEKEIAKALDTHSDNCGDGCWLPSVGVVFEFAKQLGVLNLWFTPVYEEDKVRKIGKYDVVFNTPNIKVGCTWYNKESLTKAKEVLEQPNVQAIKCDGHDLTLTDVNNLLKYFE